MSVPPPPRELTLRVIVLGLILSVAMGAANVYVGLKAGMTVSASIPAAVVAMLVFRVLFKNSTILEANQVQTAASAGESLAAGIIFTMPALILIGHWTEFDFWTVTGIAFTGGLLGILFMIPMRRVFVVDNPELPYPEGIACASVLEAGQAEGEEGDDTEARGAKALIVGGLLGGSFKVLGSFFGLIQGTLEGAVLRGKSIFYFGGDVSPMLVAVGFIVRLNVAVLIFIGGAIAWLIGIPLRDGSPYAEAPLDGAWTLWSTEIRYVGVGAMVVAGVASIVGVRKGLVAAVQELRSRFGKPQESDVTARDLPSAWIAAFSIVSIVLIALIYYRFTRDVPVTALSTVVMITMAFFFTAVASYIVGLVGNSNSPVSGMTITAVLFTGGMLWICNFRGTEGMVAVLGVAAVVCCVACTSGDVCNDLKTGSLVGASPYRQQIMQILGVFVAAFTMAPVLTLLHENTDGGIGGKELGAPQASLFASLAKGFFGDGTLPWDLIRYGAGVGVVLLGIDMVLKARGSKFRMHVMPVAVGMYLPFGLATPILLGGLIAHFASRKCRSEEEVERTLHGGILFSSGVIAGEALLGVGLAGLAALEVKKLKHDLEPNVVTWISIGASLIALFAFHRYARGKRAA